MTVDYLHGYSRDEQERLVAQAEYFRSTLLRDGPRYRPGERVLEPGCGAGAVLGVLARRYPGLRLAGIDREESQLAYAREHLERLGAVDVELRAGDAAALPWEEATFDHVFAIWFLEHLADPAPVLRELSRVLRPGGSITLTETDYTTFRVHPESPDLDALARAQVDYFASYGQPFAGRRLGALLAEAGFDDVRSAPVGFHFFRGDATDRRELAAHAAYCLGFLEPAVAPMAAALGIDEAPLRRGVEHLRRLPELPGAALTQIVYRATARRPLAPTEKVGAEEPAEVMLVPLSWDNLAEVLALRTTTAQRRFVADNALSLAHAHLSPHWMRVVTVDGRPAGFVLVEDDAAAGRLGLWRFLIDRRWQGRGVGRRALELVIEHARSVPGVRRLLTSVVEGPGGPRPFYEKLGFRPTGELDDGETVLALEL